MLSCRMEELDERGPAAVDSLTWVRTVDGWERTDCWHIAPSAPPLVHPIVVATGQGLLSVFALVAFQRNGTRAGQDR